jgi:HK97 gp10 family phage protein
METLEVKGLSELGDALVALGNRIARNYLRKATSDAAEVFRDEAKAHAPVRTGAMRDAIAIFKRPNPSPTSVMYAVGVGKLRIAKKIRRLLRQATAFDSHVINEGNEFYWRFVEFGTSKMKAQPFLRPALESAKYKALDQFSFSLAFLLAEREHRLGLDRQ